MSPLLCQLSYPATWKDYEKLGKGVPFVNIGGLICARLCLSNLIGNGKRERFD